MRVRPYTDSDLEELRRIHAAQSFPYAFPDLTNPLFVTKIVLTDGEDANEKIRGAALYQIRRERQIEQVTGLPTLDTTTLTIDQVAEHAIRFWREKDVQIA